MTIFKLEIEPNGWALPSAFEFYFTDIPTSHQVIYQIQQRERYAGKKFCDVCADAVIKFGLPQFELETGCSVENRTRCVSIGYWWENEKKEKYLGITRITKIEVFEV